MKLRLLVAALSVTLCAVMAGTAFARNPHCAGGMQYVTLGNQDKLRGNNEDYMREMNKAVEQLTAGAAEDPADYEAQGYLAWALAELDSCGPAGIWFAKAGALAASKSDEKKLSVITTNRDHYWSIAFNDGIKALQTGQQMADAGSKEDATKYYLQAQDKLTRASLLRPGSPITIRNLATAYAYTLDYDAAERVLVAGLGSPDTSVHMLTEALKSVRLNKAGALIDAKKFDEAIAYYQDLTKAEPNNPDLWRNMGEAYYERSSTRPDTAITARKGDYRLAARAYAKAGELNPTETNSAFNAAQMFQNSGEMDMAEGQWRSVLKSLPNDPEALSQLGLVLAREKKFDEAKQVSQKAVELKPEEKDYFRCYAAVSSLSGDNLKSAEMTFVYMAMKAGTPVADPAAAIKAARPGSAAANTVTSMGTPDKVLEWKDPSAGTLQTWMYTGKHMAFTFNAAGVIMQKSDWNPKK